MDMSKFPTPRDYIVYKMCQKMGTQNCISLNELKKICKEHELVIDEKTAKKYHYVVLILDNLGEQFLIDKAEHFGVASKAFQEKFGITNRQLKKISDKGYIKVTGDERFYMYGRYNYAPLYDIYAYYNLTTEQVNEWLQCKR